jgi:hypothetical protein
VLYTSVQLFFSSIKMVEILTIKKRRRVGFVFIVRAFVHIEFLSLKRWIKLLGEKYELLGCMVKRK